MADNGEGPRRFVLQVVVDVHADLEPGETVSTEQDPTHFLGSMPLLLTSETEVDGYVQSITILDTKEL